MIFVEKTADKIRKKWKNFVLKLVFSLAKHGYLRFKSLNNFIFKSYGKIVWDSIKIKSVKGA